MAGGYSDRPNVADFVRISLSFSLSLSLNTYIYIYINTSIYVDALGAASINKMPRASSDGHTGVERSLNHCKQVRCPQVPSTRAALDGRGSERYAGREEQEQVQQVRNQV